MRREIRASLSWQIVSTLIHTSSLQKPILIVSIEYTVVNGTAAGLTIQVDVLQVGDEAVPSLGPATLIDEA